MYGSQEENSKRQKSVTAKNFFSLSLKVPLALAEEP
jgi:hypothetical protein